MLIVKSEVKKLIRDIGLRSGEECLIALNKKVAEMIQEAATRVLAEKRGTLMPQDW